MEETLRTSVLKTGASRSVLLERRGGDAGGVVVKRFHHPGPLRLLRDRRRALSEFRALKALRAHGLPVPRPRGLRRDGGGWQVVMDWIPAAPALEALLAGRAPWPVPPGRVAARAGELLAALQAAGARHPDLHAGNVLVDPRGRLHLVDLQGARLGQPPGRRRLRAELVRLAAGERESTSLRFRARFLIAWLRALPPELRRLAGEPRALVQAVEDRARPARRRRVRRDRDRWTRASSRCRPIESRGRMAYIRSPVGSSGPGVGDARTGRTFRAPYSLALWYGAARLLEHRIPGAEPHVLCSGERAYAAFRVPRGTRPLTAADTAAASAGLARGLGRLAGLLHDRGLRLPAVRAADVLVDGEGRLLLAPPHRLEDFDPRPGRSPAARRTADWEALVPGAPAEWRELLREAYLEAFHHSEAERAALGRELQTEDTGA